MSTKTTLLLFTLVSIILLTAFRQTTPSIVGSWTQTEVQFVNKHIGTTVSDTTTSHDKGFAVKFAEDGQYYYTAPYNHKANGTYTISGDTLQEFEPVSKSTTWYKVLELSEHKLILCTHDKKIKAGANVETITSYMR
jgi:hypothetical protein